MGVLYKVLPLVLHSNLHVQTQISETRRSTITGLAFHLRSLSSILIFHFFPQVILIQACQDADRALASHVTGGGTPEPDPAPTQLSDPHRDQHITLTRPNTVLLLATVRGGVAYRGIFTGAMADQFRSADGKKDINAMFTLAANSTRQRIDESPGAVQIPKLENTTHKLLILPQVEIQATSNMQ